MQLPKHLKIAAGSAGAAMFGILFGWVMFPAILKSQLKKEMALSKKTDVRKMWEKVPFPMDFKIYLFNYTNVEEIQQGAIPIVKEVGPFYFEEWKEKVEVVDDDVNDTASYRSMDTFYFIKEKSGPGLTGEEIITMPHVFMLSVVGIVAKDKPTMLNMVGKGLNGIFDNPTDMFLRIKVMDILFNGMNINCARTDFAPKAICTALKKDPPNSMELRENNQFYFSFFGQRNHTPSKKINTVKRGVKNIYDVATVIEVDGKPSMGAWRNSCDLYLGTDSTKFPPFMVESKRVEAFNFDLCRIFRLFYQKRTSFKGIKTYRYVIDIGDLANDPELNCYCDTPDKCPMKGLMDLTKCMKVPIYLSLPHYLDCDPEVQKGVKGLAPDVEAHGIVIDYEPITGTPMLVRQRIQLSLQLIKTDKIAQCANLPNTLAPIMWIEEGYDMPADLLKIMKHQLFIPKKAVGVFRWMLVAFGLLGVFGSLVFHFKGRIMKFAISKNSASTTKIKPEEVEQNQDISVIGQSQQAPTKVDM